MVTRNKKLTEKQKTLGLKVLLNKPIVLLISVNVVDTISFMNPKISVIMSVYNGARHLREAIDSILSQIYTNFEFLIVDDASNDNSLQILEEYQKKDSRIKIITNKLNLGLTKSLNKAIKESKGEYIARFDCDDISLSERFAQQVAFLDAHLGCGLVGVWAEIINDQGEYVRTIKYPTYSKDLKKILIVYNPFFHPGVMFRRTVFNTVGFYNEMWRFAQDYELYFRVAKQYELANLPLVLLRYRETGSSITGSKNREQISFVLKAKQKAIREGQYSKLHYVDLLRNYISWLLPVGIRRFFKKII